MTPTSPSATEIQTGDPVRDAVVRAATRLRQRRMLRFAAGGLLAGSAIGFVIVSILDAGYLAEESLPGGGAFLLLPSLAGLVAGGLWGAASRYEPVAVARYLEHRLDLKDRLSTALSLEKSEDPIEIAQRADAAQHAPAHEQVDSAIPFSPLPRRLYIAGAVSLAMLLAYFAPVLPIFWGPAHRAEQAAVRKEGDRLLAIAKAAGVEAKKRNLPEAEKAAEKVGSLGREMQHGRMSLRDALIKRAALGDELQKAREKLAHGPAKEATPGAAPNLSQVARDWQKSMRDRDAAPAQTGGSAADGRMQSLQNALARGDRAAAARTLREMADAAERGDPKAGAERERTVQQINALGDTLQQNGASEAGSEAKQAADQMHANDMGGAANTMRDAARKLEQLPSPNSNPSSSTPGAQQNGGQSGQSRSAASEQLQKLASALGGQTGSPSSSSNSSSSQSGQQQSSQQSSGTPQSGSSSSQSGGEPPQAQGSHSSQSAKSNPSSSGGGQQSHGGTKPGDGQAQSSGGQQSGGTKPGGAPSSSSASGSGASKSGSGSHTGSGGGSRSGTNRGGGNGIGSDSSGGPHGGNEGHRLNRGAREENAAGKNDLKAGQETVINEDDTDKSPLPVSSLPYYNEFVRGNGKGGPASEAAQHRDSVPAAYRQQVRGYFDSLPGQAKGGSASP